jgi:hypothetical protein
VSDDLQRALAVLFRDGRAIDASDLAREMAFVHGWLSIGDADTAVNRMVEQGWLTKGDAGLVPSEATNKVHPPLGWMPRPSNLLNPEPWQARAQTDIPAPPSEAPTVEAKQPSILPSPDVSAATDPRARVEGRLVGFVARSSGLERDEVLRRAQRKHQALRPCTSWLALALVAREQGLDMEAIVDALSPSA